MRVTGWSVSKAAATIGNAAFLLPDGADSSREGSSPFDDKLQSIHGAEPLRDWEKATEFWQRYVWRKDGGRTRKTVNRESPEKDSRLIGCTAQAVCMIESASRDLTPPPALSMINR